MKKVLTLLTAICFLANTFAAVSVTVPPKKASEILIPIGKTGQQISLLDLSQISVKDYQQVTGKHMKLSEKLSFKLAQRELRQSINPDGTINSKKLEKALQKADGTSGFHIGGFALGFLLGLIGVLIAYLINDDKKSNRTKWAWIGFGAAVVLYILLLI